MFQSKSSSAVDSLPSELQDILALVEGTQDYEEKCDLLIEFAGSFKPCDPNKYTYPYDKNHQVPGCESEVYLWVNKNAEGAFSFDVIVENPQGISAKALAQILIEGLRSANADAIQAIPEDTVYRIFGTSLSMGKGQGLMGMIRLLKHLVKQA
jgi:sulfur transfer protein SufE